MSPSTNPLSSLFWDVEIPLIPVLAKMERQGLIFDRKLNRKLHQEAVQEARESAEHFYELLGLPYPEGHKTKRAITTNKVREILFDQLRLDNTQEWKDLPIDAKYTEAARKRHYRNITLKEHAVSDTVIATIASLHDAASTYQRYADAVGFIEKYTEKYPKKHVRVDGRVYTRFNQMFVKSGRLSSSSPNLQQVIPRFRDCFVASPGHFYLSIDLSNLELRIGASLSEDPALIACYTTDIKDVHAVTAAAVFGGAWTDYKKGNSLRDFGKTLNFSVFYGAQENRVSELLRESVSLNQVVQLLQANSVHYLGNPYKAAGGFVMERFFKAYPRIKAWIAEVHSFAHANGYTETALGRRRYEDEINEKTLKELVNMCIQGTAADILKLSMLQIDHLGANSSLDKFSKPNDTDHRHDPASLSCIKMLLQIHDELIFEVWEDDIEWAAENLMWLMEHPKGIALRVPLVSEAKYGKRWGSLTDLEVASRLSISSTTSGSQRTKSLSSR